MKTSKFKRAMPIANTLQNIYAQLGIAATQNVRNPLPMHMLISMVLPKLPDPYSYQEVPTITTMKVGGKKIVERSVKTVQNYTLFRKDYLTKGMSFEDICKELRARGFIINSELSVRQGLSKCPNIASVGEDVQDTVKRRESAIRKGASGQGNFERSLYFVRS